MTEDELRAAVQRRISPLKEVTDTDVRAQIDRLLLQDPEASGLPVKERLLLRKRLFDSLAVGGVVLHNLPAMNMTVSINLPEHR